MGILKNKYNDFNRKGNIGVRAEGAS